MRRMPRPVLWALVVLSGALAGAPVFVAARGQAPKAADASKVPPLSWTCPMDPDVVEDKAGKCPKCGMTLEPVRLDTVWTCPVHAAVQKDRPGKCPLDGRDLVQMTMSVTWVCGGAPDAKPSLEPGTCADGTPMQRRFSPRPHGNHNPQHGGQFFMAPDNWHHLEGAYFSPGVFRLYLYDDYTRPLPIAQVRAMKARVFVTSDGREFPLVRNGRLLEARIGKLPFPAALQAKVRFQPEAPEHQFDFTFEKFSRDLPPPAATMTSAPAAAAPTASTSSPSAARASATPAGAAPSASDTTPPVLETGADPALIPTAIPDALPEILTQLRTRNDQIKALIDKGSFAAVYVPAFQAKDLALALDSHRSEAPPQGQTAIPPAVRELVRSAYLLDAFGDLGNRQQIVEAYSRFADAVKTIESAFAPQQLPPRQQ